VVCNTAVTLGVPWALVFGWLAIEGPGHGIPAHFGWWYLAYFLGFCAFVSWAVWVRRMIGLSRGEGIQQTEAGYSWAAWYLPLPPWFTELFFVPLVVGAAGWAIWISVSMCLGGFLIAAALSLAIMGLWEVRRRIAAIGAVSDGMIQGQTAAWRVERQEKRVQEHAGGASGKPEFAEMASGAMPPPDMVSMRPGSDALSPDRMVWLRPKGRAPRRDGEDKSYATSGE
jgi:hypothetical protein